MGGTKTDTKRKPTPFLPGSPILRLFPFRLSPVVAPVRNKTIAVLVAGRAGVVHVPCSLPLQHTCPRKASGLALHENDGCSVLLNSVFHMFGLE